MPLGEVTSDTFSRPPLDPIIKLAIAMQDTSIVLLALRAIANIFRMHCRSNCNDDAATRIVQWPGQLSSQSYRHLLISAHEAVS